MNVALSMPSCKTQMQQELERITIAKGQDAPSISKLPRHRKFLPESRKCLVIRITRTFFQLVSTFFVHFLVCCPGEQYKSTNDQKSTADRGRSEW